MSTDTTTLSTEQKAEEFANKMLGVLNSAGIALMTSVGHRTGLFDAMSQLDRTTSPQLADKTGLNERYVREWLAAMVSSDIVEYEPEQKTYRLPPEHAALLTRNTETENIASTMQWISVMGQVEDDIVDCFQKGGGVHYHAYERFHKVMAEESAKTVVKALEEHIVPLVANLSDRLESGIDVLDVGCGSGRAMNALAKLYPNSRFRGYDFSEEGICLAKSEGKEMGVTNAHFEIRDVSEIHENEKYDFVFAFDAIHDQAKPDVVLKEIFTALKPDGIFLMQDIASSSYLEKNKERPLSPFLYTISCMHCMTVSLALGGAGLGTCWGEELACKMLEEAGFKNVQVQQLEHDILNNYYISAK